MVKIKAGTTNTKIKTQGTDINTNQKNDVSTNQGNVSENRLIDLNNVNTLDTNAQLKMIQDIKAAQNGGQYRMNGGDVIQDVSTKNYTPDWDFQRGQNQLGNPIPEGQRITTSQPEYKPEVKPTEKVDVVEGEVATPKATASSLKNRLKTAGKIGGGLGLLGLGYKLISGSDTGSEQSGGNENETSGGSGGSGGSGRTPITATDYPEVVRQVIRGEFGNGQARKNALAAAGYDYNQVQSLVNDAMARKPYNGTQINQPQTNNYVPGYDGPYAQNNPLSSQNDYANYNEYLNNLTQRQQNGYIDPNGQRHNGMSQEEFNRSYIGGQEDILRGRRNEMMANGETADQAFWRILNGVNENPNAYTEEQMNALRELAQRLGYMDSRGNLAGENGYAIDMSFANPMSESDFYNQYAPRYNTTTNQAVQATRYQNRINNGRNGHRSYSNDMARTQGVNAADRFKQLFYL